jgi:OmcA/MtrC family decaheme c-type cytochrome
MTHKGTGKLVRSTMRSGGAVALVLAAALSLTGSPRRIYTERDKAAFMQQYLIEFLRPGLQIQVNSATIGADGTITTVYTITDPTGLPLDLAGVYTPGPISLSFIAGYIPVNAEQYTTYTTRSATGAVSGTVSQAGADSGGTTTQIASGQYQYVFKTKAPAGFDGTATHTIGVYGSRNLSAFNTTNNYATTTYNFIPNGGTVTKTRDVVTTATCDNCHDQLSAHGGSRRQVQLCVMCHTPQTTSPGTGVTVDFKVFIHKLHMGSQLPSVIAGTPYQIVNSFGTSDFSTVVFPADIRRCTSCHAANSGAKQATAWLTNPTRAACGSCHDDVNFASGKNHPAGAYTDDTQCSTCHQPQGTIDFDASIVGAHVVPTDSSLLSGINAAITGVTNTLAGQKPTVNFTLTDNNKNPIPLSTTGLSLSFTMAGPTTDYGYTSFGSDVTTPGYVMESALKATCSGTACSYTFTHAVPAGSTGTYAIGVEARRTENILAGTPTAQSVAYGAKNQVIYFTVDGSPLANRRTVVQTTNCNQCHVELSLHGGLRNQTEYCVLCHNPSNTDSPTRPSATVIAERSKPNQGINFNLLVHRIHTGDNLPALGKSYTVIGFGGSINDFTTVRYPAMGPTGTAGETRNCSICHVNSSQLNLPLGKNLVTDPQGPINPVLPITSACTGCHADTPSSAHALANTDSLGESCTVCHKSGAAYAVDQVHAQY